MEAYTTENAADRFRRRMERKPEPEPVVVTLDERQEAANKAFTEYKETKKDGFIFYTEQPWRSDGNRWKKSFTMGSKTLRNTIQLTLVVIFQPNSAEYTTKMEYA